jgi:hypothetical protein
VSSSPPPLPPTLPAKRFPFVWYAIPLVLIILFATAPVISVLISGAIAEAHGCVLNEGGAHPCVINGTDWGSTLLTMFVLGWLMLFTLPAGAVALLIWLSVLVVHLITRSRAARTSA